ncbi:MAG: hypothetical protein GY935_12380, partial [Gammaproteobacteria bacterium]|nr:hypothetical protein [Gammaproteobacteria bacterium]
MSVITDGAAQVITGDAVDLAGNTATTSVIVNLDKTQPALTITSPANGSTVSDPNLQISGQVTDGTSNVSLVIDSDTVALGAGGSFNHAMVLQQGINSIAVTATDQAGNVTAQTLTVTLGSNQAPVAGNQTLAVDEDTTLGILLTGTDADGDLLTYQVITQPAQGTLTGIAPNLSYQPNTNFNSNDSFTFRVNDGVLDSVDATIGISVNTVNDAPVADVLNIGTDEDTGAAITLTGSDVDGDALTYQIVLQPTHGVLTGTSPNLTYQPNANY